jgi:probable DNA metabolism protein
MFDAVLPSDADFEAWRGVARRLKLAGAAPENVAWRTETGTPSLFAELLPEPPADAAFTAPRAFVDLARTVSLHRDERRFALLYRLLWRLGSQPRLIEIASDPDVAEALLMRKSVAEAIHQMHAFVRFRRVDGEAEETYVAWFEPPHRVAVAGVDFFIRRMANLRFSILTPDIGVHWDRQALSTTTGVSRDQAPDEDALEDCWRTYYASIFNPARLNPKVMTQHMARKYWRNLPEAALIPQMVAGAQERAEAMVAAEPTTPSRRAERIAGRQVRETVLDPTQAPASLDEVAKGLRQCRSCPLWRDATQAVPGEGQATARLMLVGEQPGDQEDLAGKPFVGPAGQLLDRALAEAGAPREAFYVTNAVKHFKHEQRGKRRLHKSPNAGETQACRWWLDSERALIKPKVIVALGATAAQAVLGRPVSVLKARGAAGLLEDGALGFVTVHPSYLLRLPDQAAKDAAYKAFVADLHAAYALATQ